MAWSQTVTLPSGEPYTIKTLLGKGDSNTKMYKSDKSDKGYQTIGLSLAPADLSGYEMCRNRSKGCTASCINTAGKGSFGTVQRSRIAKTVLLMENSKEFINQLMKELDSANKRAAKADQQLACRLNVFSDYPWEEEHPEIFYTFPEIQFYDYTKIYLRAADFAFGTDWPQNYHLTFSRSENNDKKVDELIESKCVNVTVVFNSKEFPATYKGLPVINGDETDLRFLDPTPCVVGLASKGRGRYDMSGFVLDAAGCY